MLLVILSNILLLHSTTNLLNNTTMKNLSIKSSLSEIRKAIRSGSNVTKVGAAYFVDGDRIGTGHGAKICREIASCKLVRFAW